MEFLLLFGTASSNDLARKIENNGFNFEKVVSNAFDGSDVSE